MAKAKPKYILPEVPPEEALALVNKADALCRDFHGQLDELESALGMMIMGRLFGWKLFAMIHNKRTIRKYEDILGIKIREAFPEEGPLIGRSHAYALVKQLGNYWKAVSGEFKVDGRRDLG